MTIRRRTVLRGMLGATAVLAAPTVLRAQGAPFKIGLLTVKTGPLAQGGIQMEQGILTLLKEKNNTLAGRKIEFISADTGGNPAGAKTKAQEVIERDKVNVILGPPLVTPDYTPYIAQIRNGDCVFNGFAGSNPVKFMRAYADLGLKGRIPLLAGWTAMDDALLRTLGDEAVGVLSAAWYSASHDTPSNKRFVDAMQKDYGVLPGGYSAGMYFAGQCVEAAIQKLGGQADDRKAFAEA